MSDWWLKFLARWGWITPAVLALFAGCLGLMTTYPGQPLCAQTSTGLISASATISRHDQNVEKVIGDEWDPLTASQIEELSMQALTWHKPALGIQVIYENDHGKDLARSIAAAFRAAGWATGISKGVGFGRGIEVGPGADGVKIKNAIAQITKFTDVRNVRPDDLEGEWRFVGIGAKVDDRPQFIPH